MVHTKAFSELSKNNIIKDRFWSECVPRVTQLHLALQSIDFEMSHKTGQQLTSGPVGALTIVLENLELLTSRLPPHRFREIFTFCLTRFNHFLRVLRGCRHALFPKNTRMTNGTLWTDQSLTPQFFLAVRCVQRSSKNVELEKKRSRMTKWTGCQLLDTEKSDTGIYKCISKSADGPYTTTKTELEVIDASYLPEVDEWQKNLARGLIAAASTAAFFIAACGFSYFSWDERHPEGKSNRSSISSASHPSSATSSDTPNLHELKGLDNPALAIDTNEIDSGL
ncbi:hypothetical protein GHT06_016828 [Daphnia sinensis]|uniref:Uncharacterized protein n=1 Tax=Daphnia sinensis TaxID=1820382 RepID=A0AAD5KNX3_9CRUS|nr:hypothetical protein GHT06_016828 [Daphnia sinensis]